LSRFARKVDTSDPAITATLRAYGLAVRDLSRQGGGCPDKLVASPDGRLWLVECKSAGVQSGKRLRLSPSQSKWADGWPAEVVVLRSPEDAAAWAQGTRIETAAPGRAKAGRTTPETSTGPQSAGNG
jgi:hypothetical protein